MTVTGEIRSTRKTTCPIVSLSTTDSTCPGLGSNFSLRGDRRLTTWYMGRHRRGIDRSAGMAFISRGHESDWLLPCTYFFRPACSNAIYFRTLSIVQAVWTGLSRRMAGWLLNNGLEVCGKSRPYYNLRHFPAFIWIDWRRQQIKSAQLYKIRIRHLQKTCEKHHILGHTRWLLPSQIPLTCHWFCSFYVWQKFWVGIIDTAHDCSCAVFVMILVRTWIVLLL